MDQNNDFDFQVDFSSNSGGEVATLESFLDSKVETDKEEVSSPSLGTKEDTGKEEGSLESFLPKEEAEEKSEVTLVDSKDSTQSEESQEDKGDNELQGKDKTLDSITEEENTETVLDYKNVITKLVDSGLWDKIESFDTEEGEIPFDEIDIDSETFVEIFKQKIESERENLLKDKVSTSGISEFTSQLIEIEKNGGSVQEALNSYNQFKNPLETLDLSTDAGQRAAIYLRYEAENLSEKMIKTIIKGAEAEGILEETALEAKADLEQAFDAQMKSLNDQAVQQKEERKKALKQYKSSLNESLKSFELTDSYKRKLVEVATKENEKGGFHLDTLYSEIRQDPEKSAELVLFLTDKEEYLKQVTEKASKEVKIDTMRRVKLVPKSKSSIKISPKTTNKKSKHLVDISALS